MNGRRFVSIGALGLVTIAAYGGWYYAFGVLLDPIITDTGWSEAALTLGFGIGLAVGGLLAIPGGKLLDRVGSRWVFLLGATVSTTGLWVASGTGSLAMFIAATVVAGAALASLGFYHITQATAVRVAPDQPARAIAWVTIYGAFASAIYLPLTALLLDRLDWRGTVRVLAVLSGIALAVAALVVTEEQRPARREKRQGLRVAMRDPKVARLVAAVAASGLMAGIILVYQVPLMTGAGLPLAVAAWFAGIRGAAQITGRAPLTPIVARLGAGRSLVLAYASTVASLLLLLVAGNIWLAALFALLAGFGIGAATPLHGIYADRLFSRSELGAMMGLLTLMFGLSGAIGPAVVGVLAEATGTRLWAVVIGVGAGVGALALIRRSALDVVTEPAEQPA